MATPLVRSAVNRRTFLTMLGVGATAVAGGGLLAACSRTPGSGGTATQLDAFSQMLPTYRAMELVPPDIPVPLPAAPGFRSYPSNLVDAITEKPGRSGQTIEVTTLNWGTTPPGPGESAYLDTINNDHLGVTVNFSVQDGNTYADYLTTILAARDVSDVLVVPSWNINVARFPDAVATLFEDLTPFLQRDNALTYPMLASLPTGAWRYCFWGGQLKAVPFPTDNPFAWALFHRKDLLDPLGVGLPASSEDLHTIGTELTDPDNNVWAYNDIWDTVQMAFRVTGAAGGWRANPDGTVNNKIETEEFAAALEFMTRLYADGLVHPEIVAGTGDVNQLFASGQTLFMQNGLGVWKAMQRDEQKVTPGFDMQPVPVFADNGDPLVWGGEGPIFYTFVKKDLGSERVAEILGVLNWCAAPFGTQEFELREYGVEGVHFERGADGTPVTNETYAAEYANQYTFMSGRNAVQVGSPDLPGWVDAYTAWSASAVQFLEPNPWESIKIEQPTALAAINQPTLDKITDIARGRRPLGDLAQVIQEWRDGGGDEGKELYAQALADAQTPAAGG